MKRPKRAAHAPHPDPAKAAPPLMATLCGLMGDHGVPVTCRACLARLSREQASTEPPIDREPRPARVGARRLDPPPQHVAERSRGGVRSADAEAAAYFRVVVEGASLSSAADPDLAHRVRSTSPGRGGRTHAEVERYATVARAIATACWREADLALVVPGLTPSQAKWIYALKIAGKPVRAHGSVRWVGRTAAQIADEDLEGRLTRAQVLAVARFFREAVQDALYASGELGARPVDDAPPRGLGRIDWSQV